MAQMVENFLFLEGMARSLSLSLSLSWNIPFSEDRLLARLRLTLDRAQSALSISHGSSDLDTSWLEFVRLISS